ncbi:hypothetical protein [Halomarina ordinaria]|uniref:DUF8162 domain-containing protein n=1 Tax=Halomarina ordinaria TaxID=3033939 RepID=A0ABD5UDE3_9EURY|nr:hypothetical protein [Halomarina sp. PSRA2]
MALLQSVVPEVGGWVTFGLVLLVPGVAATALCAPFLAAKRVRSLFAALPPEGSPVTTYALVGVGLSLPYVGGVLWVLASVDSAGGAWGNALLTLALLLGVLYTVGCPVVGVLALPRVGVDWDPTGYGWSTWVLLGAAGGWYATLFAVPLVVLGIVLALPGGY